MTHHHRPQQPVFHVAVESLLLLLISFPSSWPGAPVDTHSEFLGRPKIPLGRGEDRLLVAHASWLLLPRRQREETRRGTRRAGNQAAMTAELPPSSQSPGYDFPITGRRKYLHLRNCIITTTHAQTNREDFSPREIVCRDFFSSTLPF